MAVTIVNGKVKSGLRPAPYKLGHALDGYTSRMITPVLGTSFGASLQPSDVLAWADDKRDALLRDLAITVSRRGVVAIKGQPSLTNDDLVTLAGKLSTSLTGAPAESGVNRHPLSQKVFNEDGSLMSDRATAPSASARGLSSIATRSAVVRR